MKKSLVTTLAFSTIILFVLAGCSLGGSSPTAEPQETEAVEVAPEPTDVPTQPPEEPTAPPPTEVPPPTEIPPQEPEPPAASEPCTDDVCMESGSFLLARPLGPTGRKTIDPSYRYGDYRQSMQLTHRGVDFLNSTGTSVVAAADGTVVVAGDDLEIPYGPRKNYYGNLVIVEHALPGISEPVFTLYSQLSEVLVAEGDPVTAGQEIGLVGMTGVVPGSTLHFEVRYGENSYQEARNPELWLQLSPGPDDKSLGALAGRVLDADGVYQPVENIVLEQLAGPGLPAIDQFYLTTYEKSELRGMSPWEESFAISDLSPGEYQITFYFNNLEQQRVVTVESGMLTMVTFAIADNETN